MYVCMHLYSEVKCVFEVDIVRKLRFGINQSKFEKHSIQLNALFAFYKTQHVCLIIIVIKRVITKLIK